MFHISRCEFAVCTMRHILSGESDGFALLCWAQMTGSASLILGVPSAAASQTNMLIAGIAGLVAGAMSMVAGEYVSVS